MRLFVFYCLLAWFVSSVVVSLFVGRLCRLTNERSFPCAGPGSADPDPIRTERGSERRNGYPAAHGRGIHLRDGDAPFTAPAV